jgi:hypothetical protein
MWTRLPGPVFNLPLGAKFNPKGRNLTPRDVLRPLGVKLFPRVEDPINIRVFAPEDELRGEQSPRGPSSHLGGQVHL